MRRQGLEAAPIPQVFESLTQNPSRLATLLVRTPAEDPLAVADSLRRLLRQVDGRVPIYGVTTIENQLGASLAQRRFQTALLIGFAALALVLASVGIYGLVHYSVESRTQEIGIRTAVGARAIDIFVMVLREGARLSAIGLALGLLGSTLAGRALAGLLFGVTPHDPVTFAAVSGLLIVVAVAACYFPARRAMKVEPIVACRPGN
jgi:putative ABC transport system permease protein